MRRVRTFLVGAAVAALVLAAALPALAHAAYKSSNPGDGSTVASPPSQVTAEFTEPLTDSSSMAVFDPCGQQVDNGDSRPSGYEMTVSMSGDKAGTYTVQFKAQSALDSHVTTGSFTFTASSGEPCPGSEPPPGGGGTGGGGGGSGGGSSGGSGGGGSGGGSVAPQDPTTPAASGGSGGGDSRAGGGRGTGAGRAETNDRERGPRKGGGSGTTTPVAFQPAGGSTPRAAEPAPWDLPVSGVVLALVLCVMIGAAGGRVYAGIVAPPRR